MIEPAEYLAARALKGQIRVPPYPAVALKVQKLLGSGNYTMADVGALVSSDAALAVRVLGVANSAANRPASGAISSIDVAVARIGSQQVSELALAAALADGACGEGPLVHLRFLAWRRSLAAAFVAQELAGLRALHKGEGFLCGLLRDFGLAVGLSTIEVGVSDGKVSSTLNPIAYLQAAERHQKEVTRQVADKWNLPEKFRTVLEEAADDRATLSALALVVRQSVAIARLTDTYPAVNDKLLASSLPDARERELLLKYLPGLPEQIAALGAEAPARTRKAPAAAAPSRSPAAPAPLRSRPLGSSPSASPGPSPTRPASLVPASLAIADAAPFRLPVRVRKGKDTFPSELVAMGEKVAQVVTPLALQANWLAELFLFEGKDEFSLWVQVLACVPVGNQYRIDISPYLLGIEGQKRWNSVVAEARAAG